MSTYGLVIVFLELSLTRKVPSLFIFLRAASASVRVMYDTYHSLFNEFSSSPRDGGRCLIGTGKGLPSAGPLEGGLLIAPFDKYGGSEALVGKLLAVIGPGILLDPDWGSLDGGLIDLEGKVLEVKEGRAG